MSQSSLACLRPQLCVQDKKMFTLSKKNKRCKGFTCPMVLECGLKDSPYSTEWNNVCSKHISECFKIVWNHFIGMHTIITAHETSNLKTDVKPCLFKHIVTKQSLSLHDVLVIILPAKVGIKSCKGARECVSFVHIHVCTYVHSYPVAIVLSKHIQCHC